MGKLRPPEGKQSQAGFCGSLTTAGFLTWSPLPRLGPQALLLLETFPSRGGVGVTPPPSVCSTGMHPAALPLPARCWEAESVP